MRPMIDGAVIVITGASSGIGEALAKQLAGRATALALVARRQQRLSALAESLRSSNPYLQVSTHACDLTDIDGIPNMLDAVETAHGPIDVLINNAGMGDIGLFEASEAEKNTRMITLNITALTLLTRLVLPGMVARRRGVILNVSSGLGLMAQPGFAAYTGTKHFVNGFSESLQGELAGTGVLVSQLCPGPVATEFEQTAGNPLEWSVPPAVELTADDCARAAITGMCRGRVRITPHPIMGPLIQLMAVLPIWLLRPMLRMMGQQLRVRVPASSTAAQEAQS